MRANSRAARTTRALAASALLLGFGAVALGGPATSAVAAPHGHANSGSNSPGDKYPLFDFSDAYYTSNGVRVDALVGRRSGTDGLSVVDTSPDLNHRNVRATFTLPAYDPSGNTLFFTVMSDLAPSPFTANAAGQKAQQIAEASPVYVFPTHDGDPLGVGNSRQADLVDTSNGYFSNDPLALWVHVFVSYTDKAFNTAAGKKALADLAARNGLSLDGTPIIKTVSDIQNLTKQGFVLQQKRPLDAQGRYFVCPVFKDPRNGAIRPDAFLSTVQQNGAPLPAERHFVDEFNSLQKTGDWPKH
jgi:hypothetical protein